ncbi:MAG TPA: hypothetical protein VH969_19985 [Actinophytocola sp.]|jgi:hypothetical protein|uniref:hypothetical protein n=1 Tax=Actinophytocola sp. TaxID=1872138 RepID=UPI002F95CA0B
MANLVSFVCAVVPAVVLSLLGVPLPIVVLVMVGCGLAGLFLANRSRADERRETDRIQMAAVTLADWAHRNDGHCETDLAELPADGWELPATPWFHGAVLALGRRDGFEVGVTCFLEADTEGATSPHTGYLVRVPEASPQVNLNRAQLRKIRRGGQHDGLPEPVRERVAGVPADTESLDVVGGVLYLVRPRWPEFSAPDDEVAAAVGVAAALAEKH